MLLNSRLQRPCKKKMQIKESLEVSIILNREIYVSESEFIILHINSIGL